MENIGRAKRSAWDPGQREYALPRRGGLGAVGILGGQSDTLVCSQALRAITTISLVGLAARAVGGARMGQINPFTGAVPLAPVRSVAERVRRSQADSKNLPDDEAAEHVVENPDAVVMISEQHSHESPKKREAPKEESKDSDKPKDAPAHLDVTA